MNAKHMALIALLVVSGLALCIAGVVTQQAIQGEREVAIDEVPPAVKATLLAQAQGGVINEIEMDTEDGQIVYEAEVVIDGREVDIEVAADGTFLGTEADDEDDDEDEDGDEEDEDEDEEEVTVALEAVPEAVRATILAQGGTIEEIEMDTEDGQIVYEADVIIDGQEVEIEVAADGTLLGTEVDDDEDDDD